MEIVHSKGLVDFVKKVRNYERYERDESFNWKIDGYVANQAFITSIIAQFCFEAQNTPVFCKYELGILNTYFNSTCYKG